MKLHTRRPFPANYLKQADRALAELELRFQRSNRHFEIRKESGSRDTGNHMKPRCQALASAGIQSVFTVLVSESNVHRSHS